ncbi:hypothetical protein LXA43DRAFT_890572 [Ganoderma leucocontextum]|nr:hypothetical protein LXA43DRAFT_890572 [Ganoderma leucocontextum]
MSWAPQAVTQFLVEAHHITIEATFIINSLPNAELPAVERIVHQLDAVREILLHLDDPHTLPEELHELRLWRDVRKDCLEFFRQIFIYLEENGLLDMDVKAHRVCLFLVYHHRIQESLDRTRHAWNHHKIRTERNKTPVALFELSREMAMQRGYWTGDPGDSIEDASDPLYGVDGHAPPPPSNEVSEDPTNASNTPEGLEEERTAGITTNTDSELEEAQRLLADFDLLRDDEFWGIDIYCQAVTTYFARS